VPTKDGTVAVAGDIFWWTTDEEPPFVKTPDGKQKFDIEKKDEFATDMEELKHSREEILSIADWIIPGHGKMFRAKV